MARLRIGSRGSQLALWQAKHVAALLQSNGHTTTIEIIKTTGDKITEVALAQVGTKGMFTKEIEEALAAGTIDLAVHSLKDVPTGLAPGFELAAVLTREDPRDAFVSVKYGSLQSLPAGACVGTSSLRRQAQLNALRSDISVSSLRGNVDSRLRKLDSGEFDAIILAASGLHRLGRIESLREVLAPQLMCPAAGQGALVVEIRRDDLATREAIEFLDHPDSRAAVLCERAALNALGGGCQVPIGAYAIVRGDKLELLAVVARPDGSQVLRVHQEDAMVDAQKLGERVGAQLIKQGADRILSDIYGTPFPTPEQP
jgi:hydroxymethylbilane synthase